MAMKVGSTTGIYHVSSGAYTNSSIKYRALSVNWSPFVSDLRSHSSSHLRCRFIVRCLRHPRSEIELISPLVPMSESARLKNNETIESDNMG